MAKMREDDLKALLSAEKADALSAMDAAKLSEERERAMNYYNGDVSADMPTVTDRSKAVSYDVSDTVESLMPVLMEIFAGGDEVVKFAPVSEEDEDQAEQETAYINHVYNQKNPGTLITYSWMKDALLLKNGIVKVSWRVEKSEERETFYDQPDDVYALIAADEEVEIVEHTEHAPEGPPPAPPIPAPMATQPPDAMMQGGGQMMPDMGVEPNMQPGGMNPLPGPPQPGMVGMMPAEPDTDEQVPYGPTHDFTIIRKREYGCCRIEGVPPEEFGVGRNAKIGEPLSYSFHAPTTTQADLIDQGYDEDQIKELPTAAFDTTAESIARDTVDERSAGTKGEINKSNRLIRVTEHYCRMDYDGTGPKLWRVTTGGDNDLQVLKRDGKLDIEQIDFDPFAVLTPYIVTHRFFGKSAADLVIEIQRQKTSMVRGLHDNVYGANNQRLEVAEALAHPKTLDDILDNRIGGVVRTKQPGGIIPIPNAPIGDFVFPLLEYLDQVREWRTGVTRMGQGLDPEALQDLGDPARAQLMSAAQEKTKLIARIFAEVGFKPLFWKIHATVRKHESTRPTVKLMGKWTTVDPREWKRRDDLTANVGLGGGSKSEQIAFWGNEASSQMESLNLVPGLATPGQIYNSLKKRLELAGHKDTDNYWSNPDEQPPQEPKPSPEEIKAQSAMQVEQMKTQATLQIQQAKMGQDQQMAQMQAELKQREAQQKAQIESLQAQADIATQDRKTQAEIALAERKFEFEREIAVLEHNMKMQEMQHQMQAKQQEQGFQQKMQRAEHNKQVMDEQGTTPDTRVEDTVKELAARQAEHSKHLEHIAKMVSAPKRIVRGPDGRVSHVEVVH